MDSSTGGLIIWVATGGQDPIVHIKGEIDMETVPQLRACLDELAGTAVVDLTDVAFLDSTGIGVFVATQKRLAAGGDRITLRRPNDTITRTLEIVGLRDWIER